MTKQFYHTTEWVCDLFQLSGLRVCPLLAFFVVILQTYTLYYTVKLFQQNLTTYLYKLAFL